MPGKIADLFDALTFAAEKHQYQRRAGFDRLPYINHLIKVTDVLIRVGKEKDRDLLVAAILHDVVEDTEVTAEEIAEKFGEEVSAIVMEVTDDMRLPYAERIGRQIGKAESLSEKARKIRIADKSCNIRDIFSYPLDWSEDRKKAYLENAILVVEKIRGTHKALENWFDESVAFARRQLKK